MKHKLNMVAVFVCSAVAISCFYVGEHAAGIVQLVCAAMNMPFVMIGISQWAAGRGAR